MRTKLYAMKLREIITIIAFVLPAPVLSSEAWGPDLIEFDLEGGSKIETMLWVSGYSYSSSELLRSIGCLDKEEIVGSRELIVALNKAYQGRRVDSEAASSTLGRYLRSSYHCAAYNKQRQ